MQFNKNKLGLRLYTDVRKEFPQTTIENDLITVRVDDVEIKISLNSLLAEIKNKNVSYKEVLNNYKEMIREMVKEDDFKVDYHKLYPVLRSSNFGLKEPIGFYRKKLFLDLDLLYVTDYSSVIRFLTIEDNFIGKRVYEAAMFNINRISNKLKKLHPLFEVYTTMYDNDYNCGLVFNYNFVKQIKKTVGSNYLIAIPSSSTILIARDLEENIGILQELMKNDNDPNFVSGHVYRFKDGEYSYAD